MPDGPADWSPEQIDAIRNAPDLDTLNELTAGTPSSEMPDEVAEAVREAASGFIQEQGPDAGLPDWMTARPPGASRDAIEREFTGTGDIAGAAEGIYREGKTTYGQETPQQIAGIIADSSLSNRWTSWAANGPFVAGSGQDATRMNCYEFVHVAAGLAAPEGSSPGAGNTIEAVAEPGTVEEWDGESEIPKGKVVIGISEEYGQGPDSTYHFAISMGGGNVVNNRGSGPAIEEVGDVFGGVSGWRIYDKILIGDYRYVSGDQTNGANPADTSGTTTKGTSKVRNDTDEAISISSGGEQIGQTLSPGETSSALTGEGSSAVQINGPGEPSETARAIELLMAPGSHTVTPVRKGEDGFEAGTPEPTAAPCCGQPIFPLDFFHFSSPEAIARGCMSNLAWWLSGAAVILGLAIGLVFLLGGGDDPADQPSSEPAVEDQPADESAVDEPATEEQPVDQGDSGEAGEEEPDDPAEPEEPAGQSWSTSDETDLVNFNDGSAASDPLTEITGVTVTETDGCWSVTVELTGTDDAIDEASAAYDSIAYVLDVEFTDGTFGRWIWERHLGNELNGQDPDHPSAPAADVTFTDKTVTFKLPDDGRDIRRVWVSSFSNEEMGAEEFGPEVTDQVELEVPGSGG